MMIVIADDDQNLLTMLVPHLEFLGHTVMLAVNGGEFMKKITDKKVDLLIADINMPVFDGIELYTKTREMPEYASAPFILWSGIEAFKGAELAEKDSKLRFMKKPFSIATLQEVMNSLTELPFSGDYNPGNTGRLKL